jgi:hypothetical protein
MPIDGVLGDFDTAVAASENNSNACVSSPYCKGQVGGALSDYLSSCTRILSKPIEKIARLELNTKVTPMGGVLSDYDAASAVVFKGGPGLQAPRASRIAGVALSDYYAVAGGIAVDHVTPMGSRDPDAKSTPMGGVLSDYDAATLAIFKAEVREYLLPHREDKLWRKSRAFAAALTIICITLFLFFGALLHQAYERGEDTVYPRINNLHLINDGSAPSPVPSMKETAPPSNEGLKPAGVEESSPSDEEESPSEEEVSPSETA